MNDKRIKFSAKQPAAQSTSGIRIKIKSASGKEKKGPSDGRNRLIFALLGLCSIFIFSFILFTRDKSPGIQEKPSILTPAITNKSNLSTIDQYRIGQDENLLDGLYQLGLNRSDLSRALVELRKIVPREDIPNALIKLRDNDINDQNFVLAFVPDPPLYEITLHFGDTLILDRSERALRIKRTTRSHIVSYDNFFESLERDGFQIELMRELERVLSWSIDLHHIKANSNFRLKMLLDEKYAGEDLISVTIHAIEYSEGKKSNSLFRFSDQAYYSKSGQSARRQFLRSPIRFGRVSSAHGWRRNPISGQVQHHNGIDFAANAGTPIYALSDGTIEIAGYTGGNGNYIKIKHDHIYQTQYLHMQEFETGIETGVQVKQGDIIGRVGSTGHSTGPHVCLRFWKNGEQVDFLSEPMPHLNELPTAPMRTFIPLQDSLQKELNKIYFQ